MKTHTHTLIHTADELWLTFHIRHANKFLSNNGTTMRVNSTVGNTARCKIRRRVSFSWFVFTLGPMAVQALGNRTEKKLNSQKNDSCASWLMRNYLDFGLAQNVCEAKVHTANICQRRTYPMQTHSYNLAGYFDECVRHPQATFPFNVIPLYA